MTIAATGTTAEYEAEVITREPGKGDLRQTISGGPKTTAAWLRALANEIDPVVVAQTKPTCRCSTPRSGPTAQLENLMPTDVRRNLDAADAKARMENGA